MSYNYRLEGRTSSYPQGSSEGISWFIIELNVKIKTNLNVS